MLPPLLFEKEWVLSMVVRPASRDELARVNELRRMVNDLHVNGGPDIFRSGFSTYRRYMEMDVSWQVQRIIWNMY